MYYKGFSIDLLFLAHKQTNKLKIDLEVKTFQAPLGPFGNTTTTTQTEDREGWVFQMSTQVNKLQ